MQKRSATTLVLIGYGVLLIIVVVFKGPIGLLGWVRSGSEERADVGAPGRGRGRGYARNVSGSEGRPGGRGPAPAAPRGAELSTSRFAPIHANYIPFKTILPQLRGQPRWSSAIINLVGNTILFIPIGFLVRLLYRKMKWQESLVLAVAVGVTMEVMEGVLRLGVVDVDDVTLNALGVMSGYWLCRAWCSLDTPPATSPR